jgi:hypothetical protein
LGGSLRRTLRRGAQRKRIRRHGLALFQHRPGCRHRLSELDGALPELPEGWRITGHVWHQVFGDAGVTTRRRTEEPELALESGFAELHVAEPGAYTFAFRVLPAGRSYGHRSFWNEPQPVLEVRDDGTQQLFVLTAPDATTRAEIAAFVAEER